MATFEITIDDEKIQDLLQGDRGMAALLQPILNQLLQAEMTEHLRAEPGERTDQRRGWRNGSYKRQLTTRVGTLTLEVPRDREGTFQTARCSPTGCHCRRSGGKRFSSVSSANRIVVSGSAVAIASSSARSRSA